MGEPPLAEAGHQLRLRGGSLYLPREICDLYFRGLQSVILVRREGFVAVLPVRHSAAGGYFLKLRNARGDRVIDAPDFFRDQGFDEAAEHFFGAQWLSDLHGLALSPAVTT